MINLVVLDDYEPSNQGKICYVVECRMRVSSLRLLFCGVGRLYNKYALDK